MSRKSSSRQVRRAVSGQGINPSAAPVAVNRYRGEPLQGVRHLSRAGSKSVGPASTVASTAGRSGDGTAAPGRPFGMTDMIAVARKRSALIRNVALAVVAVTLLAVMLMPTTYTASAVVMLDPRKNNVAGMSSVLSELPTDPASVQNQIQILTSRDLAGEVIQRLDLVDDPEFNTHLAPSPLNPFTWFAANAEAPESQYASVIDAFQKHMSTDALGLSTAIFVKFSSADPEKAARIANAIVDAYIQSQLEVNAEVGRRTTAWLTQRVRELARQAQAADANVQRYKAENAINDTATGTGSVVEQQMAAINTQLVQARADLAAKQANDDRIRSLVRSGDPADVSQVVSSPLIVQLKTQQSDAIRDEAQITTRYGPKHPKRIAAESQLHDLSQKIEQEVSRIAGSVSNDLAVARAQVKSLETSLAQAEAQENDQNLARVQLKALESDAASTRSMYETFVTRLRETQGQEAVQVSDARVISHASIPGTPSGPKRMIILGASIPAGLLLGLLCALALERIETAGVAGAGATRPVLPVLAEIPHAATARAADRIEDFPGSPFSVGVRALARRVASAPGVVAVTSVNPRDGQTNISVALARSLAHNGRRVVIIDAQPPLAAWTTGAAPMPVDATDVMRRRVPLSRAFSRDPRSGVLMISAAARGAWLAPQMAGLIKHLCRSADHVIIDAPPLWSAETARICSHAGALLVVARKGTAGLPALSQDLARLRTVGLVLTV